MQPNSATIQHATTTTTTTPTFKTIDHDKGAKIPLPRFVPIQQRERRAPVSVLDAIQHLKSTPHASFDESIDISINLGIDPRRGDQMVRGAAALPHGTGKAVRVCVFARDPETVDAAKAAGADIVGSEDLIQSISDSSGSGLQFDKCVATPDIMPKLSKVARILGPRGLMPNPKLGTVTTNIADAIRALKHGRVEFRADKSGIIHASVGKRSFDEEHLMGNIAALVLALLSARPKGVKGSGASGFFLKASITSTMGPGIPVTVQSLVQAGKPV